MSVRSTAMNAVALTPMIRSGRRSVLRARAANHCVIVAAGRTGGGGSATGGPTTVRRQHAAIVDRIRIEIDRIIPGSSVVDRPYWTVT
jgi:hypothetical protein